MARRRTSIPSPFSPDPNIVIAPRQPGESAYSYRYRRSLELYGQTPYERRIWLAKQRGIGYTAARGHAPARGETESQRRNRLSVEQFGQTASQIYRSELRTWLEEHGYTPDTTLMTWTDLIRLAPRLRYMYNAAGETGRVTPIMIYEAIQLERDKFLPPGWAFDRLWEKYDDMVSYREYADKQPGHDHYVTEYLQLKVYLPGPPAIQWWYYH